MLVFHLDAPIRKQANIRSNGSDRDSLWSQRDDLSELGNDWNSQGHDPDDISSDREHFSSDEEYADVDEEYSRTEATRLPIDGEYTPQHVEEDDRSDAHSDEQQQCASHVGSASPSKHCSPFEHPSPSSESYLAELSWEERFKLWKRTPSDVDIQPRRPSPAFLRPHSTELGITVRMSSNHSNNGGNESSDDESASEGANTSSAVSSHQSWPTSSDSTGTSSSLALAASATSSRQDLPESPAEEVETVVLVEHFRSAVQKLMLMKSLALEQGDSAVSGGEPNSINDENRLRHGGSTHSFVIPLSRVQTLFFQPFDWSAEGVSTLALSDPSVSALPSVTQLLLLIQSSTEVHYVWEANLKELASIAPNVTDLRLCFVEWSQVDTVYHTHLAALRMESLRRFIHLKTVHVFLNSVYKGRTPDDRRDDYGAHYGQLWGEAAVDIVIRMLVDVAVVRRTSSPLSSPGLQIAFEKVVIYLPLYEEVEWRNRLPALQRRIDKDQRKLYGQVMVDVGIEHRVRGAPTYG